MTTSFEPIELLYRTQVERERGGLYGALMRLISRRPLLGGLLGGAASSAVALWQGWRGASASPEIALALCAMVVLVWGGLFFLMRRFFAQQTLQKVEVVRRLRVDPHEGLRWSETGALLAKVDRPSWRLVRAPGGSPGEEPGEEQPWPVFIVVTDEEEPGERLEREPRFVLETRVMWREARGYPIESHQRSELLPSHVASPLLQLAR